MTSTDDDGSSPLLLFVYSGSKAVGGGTYDDLFMTNVDQHSWAEYLSPTDGDPAVAVVLVSSATDFVAFLNELPPDVVRAAAAAAADVVTPDASVRASDDNESLDFNFEFVPSSTAVALRGSSSTMALIYLIHLQN